MLAGVQQACKGKTSRLCLLASSVLLRPPARLTVTAPERVGGTLSMADHLATNHPTKPRLRHRPLRVQLEPMPKRPPHRPPRWTVYVMRGKRAERRGGVFADTEAEAIAEACRELGITQDWQK